MPSNIDKAFIDNLQNFTDSLEGIVELLKQQADKGDAINQMLSAMDGPSMSEIAEDIKTLVDKTDKIDSRTKQILEEVKASRKSKESGMFGKISDGDNKKKIVDGISVIMLIAGGVLAIGMAFKLIGKVDVVSVLALGIAIYAVSKAFAEIAEIKELTLKKALVAGGIMIVISGALVASSFILKNMQSIDIFVAFSLVLVSGALGLAAYLMLKSVNKMKLTPKTVLSILMLPLILPAISLGIVLSSVILRMFQPVKDPINLIISSAAIGLAVLFIAPTLKILSKIGIKQLLMGGIGILIASTAIMASSWILSVGKYDKQVPLKWSLGTGLALLLFTPAIVALGIIAMTGIGALAVVAGAGLTLVVAASIVATSHVLKEGTYKGGPPLKWAIGTSLLVATFGAAMLMLGIIPFGKKILNRGKSMMLTVARAIRDASFILKQGTYTGGPTKEWAEGVALSIGAFSNALLLSMKMKRSGSGGGIRGFMKRLLGDKEEATSGEDPFVGFIKQVASGMVAASIVLSKGAWGAGPTPEWGKGVGSSLGAFTHALEVSMQGKKGLAGIFGGDDAFGPDDFPKFITSVAWGMVAAAEVLSQGSFEAGPTPEWGKGVGLALQPFIDLFGTLASSPKAKMLMKDLKKSKKKDRDSIFVDLIKDIAYAMVKVDRIFKGTDWTGYPSPEWGKGVSNAFDIINKIGGTDAKIIIGINHFANAITKLSSSFNRLRGSGIDKFGRLTASVTILSAVDQKQLNDVIGVLNDNKEKLGQVTKEAGRGGVGTPRPFRNLQERVQSAVTTRKSTDLTNGEKMLQDKFDEVLEKFDEVLEHMVKTGQGPDAGGDDRVKKSIR